MYNTRKFYNVTSSLSRISISEEWQTIPTFDDNGNLPPGVFSPTIEEFKYKFVDEFPKSNTRGNIFIGYTKYCQILVDLNAAKIQWVDGSYITKKLDPGDIDFATHINPMELSEEDKQKLFHLLDVNYIKANYKCHPFPIWIYSKDEPRLYDNYQKKLNYWLKWFGHDRSKNPKGIIEFNLLDAAFKSKFTRKGGEANDWRMQTSKFNSGGIIWIRRVN